MQDRSATSGRSSDIFHFRPDSNHNYFGALAMAFSMRATREVALSGRNGFSTIALFVPKSSDFRSCVLFSSGCDFEGHQIVNRAVTFVFVQTSMVRCGAELL